MTPRYRESEVLTFVSYYGRVSSLFNKHTQKRRREMTKMNKIIIIIFLALALFGREAVAGKRFFLAAGVGRGRRKKLRRSLDLESALRDRDQVVVVRPTILALSGGSINAFSKEIAFGIVPLRAYRPFATVSR